ncbi:predicted protein [Histoplasma capsulatum H143]|uniref:Uncharacterized protein n=1 Tax=Ajellomyces capsulatus (strain H143) TaxID=544712 RepID=C6HNJ7_AJECH|nr:predicted protein [Histoplasma capsulatum H143]
MGDVGMHTNHLHRFISVNASAQTLRDIELCRMIPNSPPFDNFQLNDDPILRHTESPVLQLELLPRIQKPHFKSPQPWPPPSRPTPLVPTMLQYSFADHGKNKVDLLCALPLSSLSSAAYRGEGVRRSYGRIEHLLEHRAILTAFGFRPPCSKRSDEDPDRGGTRRLISISSLKPYERSTGSGGSCSFTGFQLTSECRERILRSRQAGKAGALKHRTART